MKLRTFTASDMPGIMAQVRAALGEDAVILSQTADRATRQITVTAAVEDEDDFPAPPPLIPVSSTKTGGGELLASNAQERAWLDELSFLLRYHGVPEALAGRMTYKAQGLELDKLFALEKLAAGEASPLAAKALTRLLSAAFRFQPLALGAGGRIMLVGPPGVGKTLAVAKLAAQAAIDRVPLAVITTDNKRAGGVEQLSAFTDILKLQLQVAESPAQLAAYLRDVPTDALALIDTAGCNPYEKQDMQAFAALAAAVNAEPVLTLPAGMDPYEAADIARAFHHPSVRRLLVTRADAARRFGGVLAAADARNLAFAATSMSARVVGEVAPLEPARLARMLLESHSQTR